jgi:hypothetical protein
MEPLSESVLRCLPTNIYTLTNGSRAPGRRPWLVK